MSNQYSFSVWKLNGNEEKYQKRLERSKQISPYHTVEYLLAEQKAECYGVQIAEIIDETGGFQCIPLVIRRINDLPYMSDLPEIYYDLITPHEYSAIIGNGNDCMQNMLLLNLRKYCQENNIVFQFYRINPYFSEQENVYKKAGYQVVHSNNQICVNLKRERDEIEKDYKSNVRRNIRRAEKENLVFEIAEKSIENVMIFVRMYQRAMEILQARKFLYFNLEYFNRLITLRESKLTFVRNIEGNVIAAGIMLLDDKKRIVYYHLGCFDRAYTLVRPMNFLMHSMIMWSREQGYEIFHLGGGGKSLLQFKAGYSKDTINYYIAYDESMKDEYRKIGEYWKKRYPEEETSFMPVYRNNE